jgi:hypothetical protein
MHEQPPGAGIGYPLFGYARQIAGRVQAAEESDVQAAPFGSSRNATPEIFPTSLKTA